MVDNMRFSAGALLLFVSLTANFAAAGQLSLSGQDLVWDPQQTASPEFVVGVANTAGTTDPLFAWQLGLEILPLPGATGSLQFNSADYPPNYLLDGRSDGLTPPFTGPASSITVISDSDSEFTGVIVPTSGMALLQTDFVASPGTQGVFQIAVVPDEFQGANWFSSDFTARDFANVPFGGGPVVIGTVTVVPEPDMILLSMIGITVFVLVRCLRGNSGRATATVCAARH
ncbi:MAG TPA: hypothetical protein VGM76_10065 [Lacipirellulaceae bacterium]|jgi:hypothetical protein